MSTDLLTALTAIRDAYDRTTDMRPVCDDDFYAAVQEALNRVCDSDGNFIEAAPSDTDDDPEEFCSRCYAGVDSSEHHEKCVAHGFAEDGESASQPVQVEVTEDMVEKAARALYCAKYSDATGAWWDDHMVEPVKALYRQQARHALSAALGGGE